MSAHLPYPSLLVCCVVEPKAYQSCVAGRRECPRRQSRTIVETEGRRDFCADDNLPEEADGAGEEGGKAGGP